jgi:hypothetical protein
LIIVRRDPVAAALRDARRALEVFADALSPLLRPIVSPDQLGVIARRLAGLA